MSVFPSWWRGCALALLSAVLLGLGSGCKSKSAANAAGNVTITGNVTYLRAPLYKDANGKPTGIETDPAKFTIAPARGVKVRVFQAHDELNQDGVTTTRAWVMAGNTYTDSTGAYTFTTVEQGLLTFVELYSAWQEVGSHGSNVQVLADTVDSKLPITNRPLYMMRKGLDGTTSTTSATPGTMANGDGSVNFAVGASDTWLISPFGWAYPTTGPFPYPPTLAAGSKPLAILDSFYTFASVYGDPTPSAAAGNLDLHYLPGVTDARGTFVELNLSAYPLSYDGNGYRFFGSVAGGVPDDSYNEGVLFPIMARNHMYGQNLVSLVPTGAVLPSMTPELALVDGMPDAMASALLQTPYILGPILPGQPLLIRDVRDLSGVPASQLNAYSAPFVRTLAYQAGLLANGIVGAGTATDWAKTDPSFLIRFFNLTRPTVASGTATPVSDIANLWVQLGRLQEGVAAGETFNLAGTFTDFAIANMLSPYGLLWPGTANLPTFTTGWGLNPDSLVTPMPAFTLSMAEAQTITQWYTDKNYASQSKTVYPNVSRGEVFYCNFSITNDRTFDISVTTVPALPATAQIEVMVNRATDAPFVYGVGLPAVNRLALNGNPTDTTTPVWHTLRVRVLSPTVVQPDLQVTVQLKKVY